MIFIETKLKGAFIIEHERLKDERGFIARSWCQNEFKEHGLNERLVQCNISFNKAAGTLRGVHFQVPPGEEAKSVRCTMGAIYDVIIDLRKDSSSYSIFVLPLNLEIDECCKSLKGSPKVYITLMDNTEMYYHTTKFYHPELAFGVRYDGPTFGIEWPIEVEDISQQDREWPDF